MKNATSFQPFFLGPDGFPRFWFLQGVGWLFFTGFIFLDVIVYTGVDRTAAIAEDVVFPPAVLGCSLILRFFCRRLYRRNKSLLRAMLYAGLLAVVLAIPCGVLPAWAELKVRGIALSSRVFFFDAWGFVNYALFILICWSALYLGIKHYQALQTAHTRALEAESLAREARLQSLRYQLSPHFLFNTLNGVSSLMTQGEIKEADRMLTRLAGFLRSTLDEMDQQEISLVREASNLEQYLKIEKSRLGERLQLELLIDPGAQKALVPALLLQPLAENAIRHGISPRPAGGKLTIKAERKAETVRIAVEDDGVGMRDAAQASGSGHRGVGLSNTIERLRVLYGTDQHLIVRWPPAGGCQVQIELPWKEATSILGSSVQ
jgi:two-component sensor histidine kinase